MKMIIRWLLCFVLLCGLTGHSFAMPEGSDNQDVEAQHTLLTRIMD